MYSYNQPYRHMHHTFDFSSSLRFWMVSHVDSMQQLPHFPSVEWVIAEWGRTTESSPSIPSPTRNRVSWIRHQSRVNWPWGRYKKMEMRACVSMCVCVTTQPFTNEYLWGHRLLSMKREYSEGRLYTYLAVVLSATERSVDDDVISIFLRNLLVSFPMLTIYYRLKT